jgi:hypothetical protein
LKAGSGRILVFIFSYLLLPVALLSQELFKLYENQLPAKILLDNNEREIVKVEFQKIAKLHPDLFYFYIEYLIHKQNKKDSTNYYQNLLYYSQKYLLKKNEWLNGQLDKIAQNQVYNDKQIKTHLKQHFEELINERLQQVPQKNVTIPIDKSKLDHIALKYLTNDKSMMYDPQMDYSESRKSKEISLIKPLVNGLKVIIDSPTKNNDEAIRDLLKHWYLFDNNSENNINVAELLLALFNKKNLYTNIISFNDLASSYKLFIPQDIYNNTTRRRGISITLLDLATIHPNLIYYFLSYLNVSTNQNNPEQIKKIYNDYLAQKENYTLQKKEWALAQIKNIKNLENTAEIQESVNKYFQKMISTKDSTSSPIDKKDNTIDSNKLDFFVVQYYNRDRNLIYNKDMAYKTHRIQYERKFGKELKENYFDILKNSKLSISNFIENFLKYWYLFERPSQYHERDVLASNIILDILRKQYTFDNISEPEKKKSLPIFVSIGMAKNKLFEHKETVNIKEFKRELDVVTPLDLSQTMVSLKGRLQLRKYYTILSYLDIQFSYIFSKPDQHNAFNRNNKHSEYFENEDGNVESELFQYVVVKNGLIKFNSQKSFALKLSLPVIIVTRNIKCEFGVQSAISNVSYNYKYDYDYTLTQTYFLPNDETTTELLNQGTSGFNEEKLTQRKWFFIPTIDLIVEFNRLNLTAGLYQDYYSLNVGFRMF